LPSHSRASPSLVLSSSHPSRRAPLLSAACTFHCEDKLPV
jgi:hypothetical protein